MVALDSAVMLNPQVWVASGHVGGFSDPMVDCRTCKHRFRADHLATSQCGRRPSKHPGQTPDCDLTEPRDFNLMFETYSGRPRGRITRVYLRPETAQGIFVNFKNVTVVAARQAAVRHRADRQELPQRDHAGQLPLPRARVRADGDGVLRSAGPRRPSGTATGSSSAATGTCALGLRESHVRVRAHDADELSHYSSATSDIEYLFPIGWQELEGVANRGDYDLRQHAEALGHEARVDRAASERYVPYVIEPALGVGRSFLAFLATPTTRRWSRSAPRTCFTCIRASRRSRRPCCRWSARTPR